MHQSGQYLKVNISSDESWIYHQFPCGSLSVSKGQRWFWLECDQTEITNNFHLSDINVIVYVCVCVCVCLCCEEKLVQHRWPERAWALRCLTHTHTHTAFSGVQLHFYRPLCLENQTFILCSTWTLSLSSFCLSRLGVCFFPPKAL